MASSKPKAFDIRNFIKTENGRLTSLTLPRDLSLGGNKQKKIYKPNLNAVRNKNRPREAVATRAQEQNQRRSARGGGHLLNRAAPQAQPKYVQSLGVFSEGTAEIKRPKITSDRYLSFKEQDPSCMTVPKVAQNSWDVDVKQESLVMDDLLGGDSSSDDEAEGEYGPIVLPLDLNRDGFMSTFSVKKEEVEEEEVKREIDGNDLKLTNGCVPTPMGLRDGKLYSDERPCISLVRMPDSLPGKGYAEDTDKPVDYNLGHLNEGKIGKVLVRRSGKVEVYIGRTKYILDVVDSSLFKEAVMSISDESTTGRPNVVDLGDIDEKYILSPSWKKLFQSRDNKLN